jgi:small-conductance mechanosensitive channel
MAQFAAWLRQHGVTLEVVLGTVLILLGTGVGALGINWFLRRALLRLEARQRPSYETVMAVTRILSGAVWVCGLLVVLNSWGIAVTGIWTLLVSGATVIGVGFLAFWTIISNITASLFLTIWRPFRLGHSVEILPEALKGRVVERNLMFTMLREEAGAILHVPNNLFFQKLFRVMRSDLTLFERLEADPVATTHPADRQVYTEK